MCLFNYWTLMISVIHVCWFCSIYSGGVITTLSARIHVRLYGCTGSSCPEQNDTTNPDFMLIVNYLWQQWSWQDYNLWWTFSKMRVNIFVRHKAICVSQYSWWTVWRLLHVSLYLRSLRTPLFWSLFLRVQDSEYWSSARKTMMLLEAVKQMVAIF